MLEHDLRQAVSVSTTAPSADNIISTAVTVRWTPKQLGPLVYVMLHDIQDAELGIRTHASETLALVARYAASAAAVLGTAGTPSTMEEDAPSLVSTVIYPALRRALQSHHDHVRKEVLRLLAQLIRLFPRYFTFLSALIHENAGMYGHAHRLLLIRGLR